MLHHMDNTFWHRVFQMLFLDTERKFLEWVLKQTMLFKFRCKAWFVPWVKDITRPLYWLLEATWSDYWNFDSNLLWQIDSKSSLFSENQASLGLTLM